MLFAHTLKQSVLTLAALAFLGSHSQVKADTPHPDDKLYEGLRAFNCYDLKHAKELLTKYKSHLHKAGQTPEYEADEALNAIPLAEDMLAGRVEQLVIVDSIATTKGDALKEYRLSTQAGRIFEPDDFNDMGGDWAAMTPFGTSYESEDGSLRYIGVIEEVEETGDDGEEPATRLLQRVYEGYKLADGSWSEPAPVFDPDVEAAYPFMLADGCTFYFASRSEAGLGGYDIFRSYRDSETGEFQNPVNMGLPYNSPSNDLMLAIDEYSGAGWWVTDRADNFADEGEPQATIYIFLPSEIRHNYDADTPGIEALAALWTLHYPQEHDPADDEEEDGDTDTTPAQAGIPGWKLTWPDDADYSDTAQRLRAAPANSASTTADEFRFTADGGKIYTRYDQLPEQARLPMQRYLEALQALHEGERLLAGLRQEYRLLPSNTSRRGIEAAQQQADDLRRQARLARNDLFSSLRK